MKITTDEAARALIDAGFTGWQVVTMGAIGVAESGLELYAVNPNDHDPSKVSFLWPDLGWLQINSFWNNSIIADHDYGAIFDPLGNAKRARRIFIDAGGLTNPLAGYKRWNTYGTINYQEALPEARAAARRQGVRV